MNKYHGGGEEGNEWIHFEGEVKGVWEIGYSG